jgi:hypothetical protein
MPSRQLLLHLTAAATASGGGCWGRQRGQGTAEGRPRKQGRWRAGSRVVAAASLALSLSPLFIGGGWLGLRGVVVGPAEMGLLGLRFKVGERR